MISIINKSERSIRNKIELHYNKRKMQLHTKYFYYYRIKYVLHVIEHAYTCKNI